MDRCPRRTARPRCAEERTDRSARSRVFRARSWHRRETKRQGQCVDHPGGGADALTIDCHRSRLRQWMSRSHFVDIRITERLRSRARTVCRPSTRPQSAADRTQPPDAEVTDFAVDPNFFDEVRDALSGAIPAQFGRLHSSAHRGGLKVWFDDATREHYEAQLIRQDGEVVLEIGFHAEHPKAPLNDAALATLTASEKKWRKSLGVEPVAGEFIGRATWRRVSECWAAPELDNIDAAIEVADRLADYIRAFEPLRRVG